MRSLSNLVHSFSSCLCFLLSLLGSALSSFPLWAPEWEEYCIRVEGRSNGHGGGIEPQGWCNTKMFLPFYG